MLTVDPKNVPVPRFHSYLLGAVTPRPIAFASTVDKNGMVNLSPFSFFNCFGANPPILIFSPSRRVRDNTTKHTYQNLLEVPEAVINIVNYSMVQQASLASTEYPKGVNEFIKAGFTELSSVKVKPPRVSESPVSMECRVLQMINTGEQGGAGTLVICEVLLMHISEEVLDAEGRIDPFRLDAVARLGGDYYCRVRGDMIFKVPKPLDKTGIGIDQLPPSIRKSRILSGNDLAILANVEQIPAVSSQEINRDHLPTDEAASHALAKKFLETGDVHSAWQALLQWIKE